MNDAPIGFFDSGVGGLTIWKEVVTLLPAEHTVYLADSINAPYGDRSSNEILELSRKNSKKLLEFGCKLIVVACNTATTNAIAQLRSEFEVPFVGIEPAIKPAALQSKSRKIGVLATRGTLASGLFAARSKDYSDEIKIFEQEGVGLVRLIESGIITGPDMEDRISTLVQPMLDKGIDHLVLGCTHYPFLRDTLEHIVPEGIKILDCGLPVARQVKHILTLHHLLNDSSEYVTHRMFTNSTPEVMQKLLLEMGYAADVTRLTF